MCSPHIRQRVFSYHIYAAAGIRTRVSQDAQNQGLLQGRPIHRATAPGILVNLF